MIEHIETVCIFMGHDLHIKWYQWNAAKGQATTKLFETTQNKCCTVSETDRFDVTKMSSGNSELYTSYDILLQKYVMKITQLP